MLGHPWYSTREPENLCPRVPLVGLPLQPNLQWFHSWLAKFANGMVLTSNEQTKLLWGSPGEPAGYFLWLLEVNPHHIGIWDCHVYGSPVNKTESVYLYLLNSRYSLMSSLINIFSFDKAGRGSVCRRKRDQKNHNNSCQGISNYHSTRSTVKFKTKPWCLNVWVVIAVVSMGPYRWTRIYRFCNRSVWPRCPVFFPSPSTTLELYTITSESIFFVNFERSGL